MRQYYEHISISFKEFIKTHKSFYIERCKNKNIEFYVDVSRDFDLRLNRGMLNQVFDNLFSNAEYWLDYSAQQGLIENKQYHISAIERGIIVVWDNGIGISPDLETRLFDVLNFFNCLIVACAMEYLQHLQKFREFDKRL